MPNSLYKYNLSNFNQIGGSIGFAPNGMPTSISANYSQTNGERKYVDDPTTFIIGEGSNLKVGKVENTASAIGTSGNGKLSIDEYVGHNLENKDKTTTRGGSVSLPQSSIPISGVGVNYANRDLESVTKNTVVGNVEIGKSSGDEINKDLSKEYKNLINSKKQQELEGIKKDVKEIIKEQASVKAEVLDKFTSEELNKLKKDLGNVNLILNEKTGAVIGPKGRTGEIIGKTSNGDKVIKMYGNQYYKITEKGKVKIAAEDVIKFKNPVTDTDGNNLIFGGIKKIEDTPAKKDMFESTKNKIDNIARALTGKSKTQRQLENLEVDVKVRESGIKIDGTFPAGDKIDKIGNNKGHNFKTFDIVIDENKEAVEYIFSEKPTALELGTKVMEMFEYKERYDGLIE